jgi:arsenite oxidase small subunit
MTRLRRRDALRLIVLTGAATLLIPLGRLTGFLFPERNVGPVTYSRELVSNTADIAVNASLFFEYPHKDRPAVLIHLSDGGFVAYDATCTHLGCQVHYDEVAAKGWEGNPQQVFCPCHGGVFDPQTGKVVGGRAFRPLPKIKLEIDDNGDIFANGYESGLPLYGEG